MKQAAAKWWLLPGFGELGLCWHLHVMDERVWVISCRQFKPIFVSKKSVTSKLWMLQVNTDFSPQVQCLSNWEDLLILWLMTCFHLTVNRASSLMLFFLSLYADVLFLCSICLEIIKVVTVYNIEINISGMSVLQCYTGYCAASYV